MDYKTFERMMQILSSTWTERELNADLMTAYWYALGDLDDSVFLQAIKRTLRTPNRWFPSPGDIRQHAEDILTTAGALPPEPDHLWAAILREARRWAMGNAFATGNAEADRALSEIGGIMAIARAENDQVGYLRHQFIQRYGTYRQRRIHDDPNLMRQPLPESGEDARQPERIAPNGDSARPK